MSPSGMLGRAALVGIDVSEEYIISIVRVTGVYKSGILSVTRPCRQYIPPKCRFLQVPQPYMPQDGILSSLYSCLVTRGQAKIKAR
jgi:hypothetical protein